MVTELEHVSMDFWGVLKPGLSSHILIVQKYIQPG